MSINLESPDWTVRPTNVHRWGGRQSSHRCGLRGGYERKVFVRM